MAKNSLIEDIFEIVFKNHVAGIVISVISACGGFYLSSKVAPVGAKPADIMFIPLQHMIGSVLYILSVVVLFISGIGYIFTSFKRKKQSAYFGTRRTLDDIKNLSWKEFEEFVGSLFGKLGYSVEVTGGLDDGGVDLILKKDGRVSLVQCKNYRVSKVSLSHVRDFYGAMNANLNYEAGYFITTGMFTLDAKHFAEDKPIELIDGAKLMDYVRMTSQTKVPSSSSARSNFDPVYSDTASVRRTSQKVEQKEPVTTVNSLKAPVCPRCGANMVQRTAMKGERVGQKFWGCLNFPKCHATKLFIDNN